MTTPIEIRTERLFMRQWRPGDREPFAQINADPGVMAYFPKMLGRVESDAIATRMEMLIALQRWGFWVVELLETGAFIGVVGLNIPSSALPCFPCVEIGWRLAQAHWGKGYACEAAGASLRVGFEMLDLDEIVAFTALSNARSQRVMKRLGMHRDATDFAHPDVAPDSVLSMHALYRLSRAEWQAQAASRYLDLR